MSKSKVGTGFHPVHQDPLTPRCSCSLPCLKAHEPQCQRSSGGKITSGTEESFSQPAVEEGVELSRSAERRWLDESAVQELFAQHPELQQQLRRIYEAAKADRSNFRDGPHSVRQREKAMRRQGLAQLRQELKGNSEVEADGLDAFRRYIENMQQ